jgi:pyrrolidone-carboxylate peptidase
LLSWSEAEADITAERTKTALSARRRDGSATSQAHWGTEFDVNGKDKTLRWISTTHRAVVYYIKQTRARKNISFETIAADVNDMFLKDSNTKITKDTANRIYKNQAYDRIK